MPTFIKLLFLLLLILIFSAARFLNKVFIAFPGKTLGTSGLAIFIDYSSPYIYRIGICILTGIDRIYRIRKTGERLSTNYTNEHE